MECLLCHSIWLSNKYRDLGSILNIIQLLNKIEQEKLEIIVTSNLRLRKCLSHNFVPKNRLRHICDFCVWMKMCVKHN